MHPTLPINIVVGEYGTHRKPFKFLKLVIMDIVVSEVDVPPGMLLSLCNSC